MIFKTQTDDFGRITTGINKDFKSSFMGILNGDFFKKQSLFSDSDINAIKAYNAEINRCVTSQTAFYRTMQNASVEAQNVVAAANGNTVALNNLTRASKAGELGMKALSVAGNMIVNMGVAFVVTSLISGIVSLINKENDLLNKAKELGEELNDSTTDIDSYKNKIDELKGVINDSSSSIDDVAKAREELMKIIGKKNRAYQIN